MSGDVENRMVQATGASGTEYYSYGPSNERLCKREESSGGMAFNYVYYYGVDGALLTTSGISGNSDYNV